LVPTKKAIKTAVKLKAQPAMQMMRAIKENIVESKTCQTDNPCCDQQGYRDGSVGKHPGAETVCVATICELLRGNHNRQNKFMYLEQDVMTITHKPDL
jgi:hypothetical protein